MSFLYKVTCLSTTYGNCIIIILRQVRLTIHIEYFKLLFHKICKRCKNIELIYSQSSILNDFYVLSYFSTFGSSMIFYNSYLSLLTEGQNLVVQHYIQIGITYMYMYMIHVYDSCNHFLGMEIKH